MSVIPPKSSDFLAGSSVAFVKPMPQRGTEAGADQGDSAEFDLGVSLPAQESALTLWRQLQPDPEQSTVSSVSCAGVMLGHFRIEEQIGRGGMGAVFRAVDTRLDREVALKVLAGSQSGDRSAVERFLNEARAAARLDHDNVARVFYVGEDQGLHFIAFEFIHGANVRQVIDARGLLSPLEAVNYGLQIAHALRHVADAGVVHRDVKPSNIIIMPTGRAKLVDLGLARKHDPEASKELTVDGTTLGTFDYISPEQAKDPRKVDIRSDIYSLGCTLYHMLTGEPPYPQGTMLQKLLDHQGKDVPAAAERNGNVPPELSAVVKKMMASAPSERYATADELIGDLSILAHAYGLRPIAPGSLVWAVPGRPDGWTLLRRYRAWLGTAALLVFAVFLIDAVSSEAPLPRDASEMTADSDEGTPAAQTFPPPDQRGSGPSNPDVNLTPAGRPMEGPSTAYEEPLNIGPLVSDPAAEQTTGPEVMTLSGIEAPSDPGLYQPLLDLESSAAIPPDSADPPSIPERVDHASEPATSTAEGPDNDAQIQAEPVIAPELPIEPFVVRIGGQDPKGYASLEAACRDAPDGSSIELNFDGLLSEPQRPVRFSDKRLLMLPLSGRRPLVRFAVPEELMNAEIVRMISVSRGSLDVYDVDFLIEVDPDFNTDQWVFLSLSQADNVMLRGVSVTIRNANLYPAAIVELAESPGAFDDRMPEAMDRPPVRFEAEDCFFRGQADLFLDENVDPIRIRLSNVAAALDGSLIRFLGMETFDVLSDMNNDHLVELELRHLTASLASEVARFEIAAGKSVPRLAVSADNSVIVIDAGRPLVTMTGDIDPFDPLKLLEWSGDHSFIQVRDPVWSISVLYDERDVDLSEWNDLWKEGRLDRPEGLNLLPRELSVAYSEMTSIGLSLVASGPLANPARAGASDGTDAGVQWESPRLPRLSSSADTSQSPFPSE